MICIDGSWLSRPYKYPYSNILPCHSNFGTAGRLNHVALGVSSKLDSIELMYASVAALDRHLRVLQQQARDLVPLAAS